MKKYEGFWSLVASLTYPFVCLGFPEPHIWALNRREQFFPTEMSNVSERDF